MRRGGRGRSESVTSEVRQYGGLTCRVFLEFSHFDPGATLDYRSKTAQANVCKI